MPSPEEIAASALAGMETRISAEDQDHQPQPEEEQKAAAPPPEASKKPPRKRRGPKPKLKFPVEPVVIQTVPRRKEYINHSYRDFSNVPPDEDDNREKPLAIQDMTFSQKVHDILSHFEEFGACISWQPHGRAFQIRIPADFEKRACPRYFGHKRYSSFLRQLNNHGFKHISKGVDRNCYYHEVCVLCRESACVCVYYVTHQ